MEDVDKSTLITLTTEMVAAYVEKNSVRPADLPGLIASLHGSLSGLGSTPPEPIAEPLKPAVSIKKSITDDYIISLEDGRKLKSMKRYLAGLGMTPEDYRRKWGLPQTYPMVAPAYAKTRSELARSNGLGRKAAAAEPEPSPAAKSAVEAPKKRGRAKSAP